MNDNDDLLSSFLYEVEDYYEEVCKGINMIKTNHISEGIDVIMRPLHTIKGTSGFIEGLEVISKFTHRVEDYLKGIQNGKIPPLPQILELLMRAVDMIFHLLDQAKNNGKIDDAEGRQIMANIEKILTPSPLKTSADTIVVEDKNEIPFIRINMARIHLPNQYQLLTDTFKNLEKRSRVVLDFSRVRSIGSTAWGAIWEASGKMKISIVGMNETCNTIFTIWGFDRFMSAFKSEDDFWIENKAT